MRDESVLSSGALWESGMIFAVLSLMKKKSLVL